jgi:type IV pilus assembly protein PilA
MKSVPQHLDADQGFTLIELLVVVLILGILMAIAIPTFLNLTGSAKTNAAESDLTTAAQDETIYLTQNGSFDTASTTASAATTDNVAAMTAADPGINWTANLPGGAGTKSVAVTVTSNTTPVVAYLETAAANGTWYWIKDTAGALTYLQTSVIVSASPYVPASTDTFVTSWKALPSTVASS